MASSTDGDEVKPLKFTEILSQKFLKPASPKNGRAPEPEPDRILDAKERKAAMSTLNAMELKWAKAGLILDAALGIFLTLYLSSAHRYRTATVTRNGHKVKELVPIGGSWLAIGGIILLFCGLGFFALRKRKRTLVAFSFFVTGFAFTLLFAPLGFALIFLGGWLMLRAYRLQKYGTANMKMVAKEAAARPSRKERQAAAKKPVKPSGYQAPKANKRYTPKAPTKKKVPKPAPDD